MKAKLTVHGSRFKRQKHTHKQRQVGWLALLSSLLSQFTFPLATNSSYTQAYQQVPSTAIYQPTSKIQQGKSWSLFCPHVFLMSRPVRSSLQSCSRSGFCASLSSIVYCHCRSSSSSSPEVFEIVRVVTASSSSFS